MHGFSQSHVEYTTHRSTFIVGHGGERKKNLHLHASTHEILSFSRVSQLTLRRRSFMDSGEAVRLQAPSPDSDRCFVGFFPSWTDPVYILETLRIMSHRHCLCYILNRTLSEWCLASESQHKGTNYRSILQGASKKMPHFPGEAQFSWSSLFHSLNYLLGSRRRTFKLRRSVRFCLS